MPRPIRRQKVPPPKPLQTVVIRESTPVEEAVDALLYHLRRRPDLSQANEMRAWITQMDALVDEVDFRGKVAAVTCSRRGTLISNWDTFATKMEFKRK